MLGDKLVSHFKMAPFHIIAQFLLLKCNLETRIIRSGTIIRAFRRRVVRSHGKLKNSSTSRF